VKTTDVLRRRSADALRALAASSAAVREGADTEAGRERVEERRHAASRALERVDEVAPALRALRRARWVLAEGRAVPGPIRSWAGRWRIPAAVLADLVTDAAPELERASAALRESRDARAELQALGLRMRAIKSTLEEMRPASG
jgi:hypothetical protein